MVVRARIELATPGFSVYSLSFSVLFTASFWYPIKPRNFPVSCGILYLVLAPGQRWFLVLLGRNF
jgi:hypothetical protein